MCIVAQTPPAPVTLRRVIIVHVQNVAWGEVAALRHRQWFGIPVAMLLIGLPFAVICGAVAPMGAVASVLVALGVLVVWMIVWLTVGLTLESCFAVTLVLWRWTHPATSWFHVVRTDDGVAVAHFHRSGEAMTRGALVAWPHGYGLGRQCMREVRQLHPGPISAKATNRWLMSNYYRQTGNGKGREMHWEARTPQNTTVPEHAEPQRK